MIEGLFLLCLYLGPLMLLLGLGGLVIESEIARRIRWPRLLENLEDRLGL